MRQNGGSESGESFRGLTRTDPTNEARGDGPKSAAANPTARRPYRFRAIRSKWCSAGDHNCRWRPCRCTCHPWNKSCQKGVVPDWCTTHGRTLVDCIRKLEPDLAKLKAEKSLHAEQLRSLVKELRTIMKEVMGLRKYHGDVARVKRLLDHIHGTHHPERQGHGHPIPDSEKEEGWSGHE